MRKRSLYAFDMLAGEGEDHRSLPLSVRMANLDRLFSRQVDGIFMADYEKGEIEFCWQQDRLLAPTCLSRASMAKRFHTVPGSSKDQLAFHHH